MQRKLDTRTWTTHRNCPGSWVRPRTDHTRGLAPLSRIAFLPARSSTCYREDFALVPALRLLIGNPVPLGAPAHQTRIATAKSLGG